MRPRGPARLLALGVGSLVLLACASRGKELFTREGCDSCHRFEGRGSGGPGPDLTGLAQRRDAAFVRRHVANPAANNPEARMPSFSHLSWFDLHSLAAYLRR